MNTSGTICKTWIVACLISVVYCFNNAHLGYKLTKSNHQTQFNIYLSETTSPATTTSASTSAVPPPIKSFEQSYIDQKNYLILEKLQKAATSGNLTDAASQYVNFCDQSFDNFLQEQITALPTESAKQKLGKVRYEVNSARQRKLREADMILRSILQAGALKPMEAKLMYHLKRNEIDMAFMVILQLNIEDAVRADSTLALQIMTHLRTLITEYQDNMVTPPVRLMRLLVRTDDSEQRREILRQKLLVDEYLKEIYYTKRHQALELLGINNSGSNTSSSTGSACCASSSTSAGSGSEGTSSCSSNSNIASTATSNSSACSNPDHNHDHSHEHSDSSHDASLISDDSGSEVEIINTSSSSTTSSQQRQIQKKEEMTAIANAQCEHIVIESTATTTSTSPTTTDISHDHSNEHSHSHEHNHDHNNEEDSNGPKSYGEADVDVQQLIDTIVDVQMQMCDNGNDQERTDEDSSSRFEMLRKCEELRLDLYHVLAIDLCYPLNEKQVVLLTQTQTVNQ